MDFFRFWELLDWQIANESDDSDDSPVKFYPGKLVVIGCLFQGLENKIDLYIIFKTFTSKLTKVEKFKSPNCKELQLNPLFRNESSQSWCKDRIDCGASFLIQFAFLLFRDLRVQTKICLIRFLRTENFLSMFKFIFDSEKHVSRRLIWGTLLSIATIFVSWVDIWSSTPFQSVSTMWRNFNRYLARPDSILTETSLQDMAVIFRILINSFLENLFKNLWHRPATIM